MKILMLTEIRSFILTQAENLNSKDYIQVVEIPDTGKEKLAFMNLLLFCAHLSGASILARRLVSPQESPSLAQLDSCYIRSLLAMATEPRHSKKGELEDKCAQNDERFT